MLFGVDLLPKKDSRLVLESARAGRSFHFWDLSRSGDVEGPDTLHGFVEDLLVISRREEVEVIAVEGDSL